MEVKLLIFKKSAIDYLIVWLGNPGREYENTRHNAGFKFLDYLSGKLGVSVKRLKHMSLCEKCDFGGFKVLLMKPQTYMNHSGEAIRDAMDFYKLSPENVIVISDDTTLLAGSVRIREKGSAGGHNGLKSIISHLGTDGFMRIRLGVGSKWGSDDLKDFVLENMSSADLKELCDTFDGVAKAIELMMKGDVQRAMALYNKTRKEENKENG